MSQAYKTCPICGAHAHHNAAICPTCGTTLTDVRVMNERESAPPRMRTSSYDYRYGEADLFEGELRQRRGAFIFGGLLALVLAVCAALLFIFGARLFDSGGLGGDPPTPSASPSPTGDAGSAGATPAPISIVTNTPRPVPNLLTVTPAPATPTPSPTQGPCTRQVQSGDTLFGLAAQCGHRDLAIIDLIVELNELTAPEAIQIGQEIVIPWPTPTLDPMQPTDESQPGASSDIALGSGPTLPLNITPTETLQPGVGWHLVVRDETMLSIAVQYNASAEVLSQLNPEIEFLQCDFEFDSGGPACIVQLIEGQQIRVPVPSPTPTATFTPSGSETPTPTATPTFNAPSALSPGDRAFFQRDQLITLRWVTTGTLAAGDVYRVRVRDLTSDSEYTADTRELFFIVPAEWQGTDNRRHEFEWSVSVIRQESADAPTFTTETRIFIWESRAST